MDYRLPIPENWQDFESICHRLWVEIWNDPTAQKHGRNGQAQHGVDIYGSPIYSSHYAGVQCKDKNGFLGSKLESDELIAECEKAISFYPEITTFTMATTAPRDAKLQEEARILSEGYKVPFDVQVWSWDDIQAEIIYRPTIRENYFKNVSIPNDQINCVILNRYSPKDQLHAFFSRPFLDNHWFPQLKELLTTIAYELSDNAYRHGKATKFQISVDANVVSFRDNGASFNPLKDFISTPSSESIGSFVIEQFLKQFDEILQAGYSNVKVDGEQINLFTLEIDNEKFTSEAREHLELEISSRHIAGVGSAERLAASVPVTDEIKEVVWWMREPYFMSWYVIFLRALLDRLNRRQRLIVYMPRQTFYLAILEKVPDERLVIKFI